MRRLCLLPVFLLALAVPAAGQGADSATVSAELDQVYARFAEGYRQASADMVAELYAVDAYYLQPDADIVRGRATIAELFARFLDPFQRRGGGGPVISFEVVERRIAQDMAWDVGYYDIGGNGRDGKFVVLWRKDGDGRWRIYTDAYSGVHP